MTKYPFRGKFFLKLKGKNNKVLRFIIHLKYLTIMIEKIHKFTILY